MISPEAADDSIHGQFPKKRLQKGRLSPDLSDLACFKSPRDETYPKPSAPKPLNPVKALEFGPFTAEACSLFTAFQNISHVDPVGTHVPAPLNRRSLRGNLLVVLQGLLWRGPCALCINYSQNLRFEPLKPKPPKSPRDETSAGQMPRVSKWGLLEI